MNSKRNLIVIGGGAAGFFGAISCAETAPASKITILEKSSDFLAKVRISGGGRCNVTNACEDPKQLVTSYPRGGRELIGPFHRFGPRETKEWFTSRGVKLKTEPDGRMFPITDDSATVINLFRKQATALNIETKLHTEVIKIEKRTNEFAITLSSGEMVSADALLITAGGLRSPTHARFMAALPHILIPSVPSLFTFHVRHKLLTGLAGVSLGAATISTSEQKIPPQTGPLLITHWGLSGPAILRFSAWGARRLHDLNYNFPVLVNWAPSHSADQLKNEMERFRHAHGKKLSASTPVAHVPNRLWERMTELVGIADKTWATIRKQEQDALVQLVLRSELPVTGKSLNKDEFVTCGGVNLKEVDFRTMESKLVPNLYFAGEVLDIDGVTGGFNFQAAWTTGFIAGQTIGKSFL